MIDAVLSPGQIGAQKEFDIGRGAETVPRFQLRDQVRARIQTGVGNDPGCSVQTEGLVLSFRLGGCLQKCMTESNRAIHPDLLGIRTAKSEGVRQSLQRAVFHWTFIQLHNANDAAHFFTLQIEETGPRPTDCNHKRTGFVLPWWDGYKTRFSRRRRATALSDRP